MKCVERLKRLTSNRVREASCTANGLAGAWLLDDDIGEVDIGLAVCGEWTLGSNRADTEGPERETAD